METIIYNISQVLGITIIHSLWQALIVYFLLRTALTLGNRLSSQAKYALGVTALVAVAGWFVFTFINQIQLYNWLEQKPAGSPILPLLAVLPAGIATFNDQSIRLYYNIEGYLPYITLFYLGGLVVNSSRLVLARLRLKTIKRNMSIDIALQLQVNRFTEKLGIAKKVVVGLSKMVDVPCMTGYLKPVILIPFSLSTLLTTEEIESILLHELAHIRRSDYLVNLLQRVIGIFLFFNPCAILINRIINEERENCCDDLVVKATANPLIYAKALLKVDQTRLNDQKLALAATGNKYYLLNRIHRIMKTKQNTTGMRPALAAMLILTATIGCVALLKPEIASGKISFKSIKPVIGSLFVSDTAHKSKTAVTKKYHHTAVRKATVSEAANDQKMEELNAEIQKHSEAINEYYNSGEFKKLQEDINALSQQMQEFYNRPDLKQKQEELQQASQDFARNYSNSNGDQQKLAEEMKNSGLKINAYFTSAEFKQLDKDERIKYGISLKKTYDDDDLSDENYQNYKHDVESKLPPEVKELTKHLEEMGKQMSARFETPEYKEKNHRMQELGDSLNNAYKNPEIKEKQEEINKLSRQIGAYQNNPEIKREQELLNQAVRKMKAYLGSPEYKSYLKTMMKVSMNYNFNYNFNNADEKPEAPEKPEQPEAPEKPEAPETNNQFY
jgi:bla regulator protein BlaR1